MFQDPRALLPRAAPRAAAEPGPGPPRPQKALVVPTVDGAFVGVLGARGRRPGPRGWAFLPGLSLQFLA